MTLRCAVDKTTTANLRAAKLIELKASVIGKNGHLFFAGADKSRLRPIIFKLYREKCCVCGAHCPEQGTEFTAGHWHHKGKCDCPTRECAEIRCNPFTGRKCHSHREPGFQRVAHRVQSNLSGENQP